MNERALIKKCQKGEADAFEELIRIYYPYISGFLLKTTSDGDLTQDLTQETFLKMIRAIEKFDVNGSAGFGTWIVAIAKNCYIDHLRRNQIYPEDFDSLQIGDGKNIEEDIGTKLQYEKLLSEIEKLPPEQGLAIRMKYEADMTLEQIAERFGVPPKTVKSRIHDGTAKLRKIFGIGQNRERTETDGK